MTILTQLNYEPMILMNTSFWLNYGLLDIDLMFMNASVVFYALFNDVRIMFNWYLGCIRLMNIHWYDLVSLKIVIIVLNWCSWPLVRALWCGIGWFSIELRCWGWSGGTLTYSFIFCILDFNYIVIGMVHLWWRCYVLYL